LYRKWACQPAREATPQGTTGNRGEVVTR